MIVTIHLISKWPPTGKRWGKWHKNEVIRARPKRFYSFYREVFDKHSNITFWSGRKNMANALYDNSSAMASSSTPSPRTQFHGKICTWHQLTPLFSCCHANEVNSYRDAFTWQQSFRSCHQKRSWKKKVFFKIFSKFKTEKAPNVLYRHGLRHFEVEQSASSLPLLEAYHQHICHLHAKNEQLKKWKILKSLVARQRNWQREELKFSDFARNFRFWDRKLPKVALQLTLYRTPWNLTSAAKPIGTWTGLRSLWREKIGDYFRNAAEILPAELKPI